MYQWHTGAGESRATWSIECVNVTVSEQLSEGALELCVSGDDGQIEGLVEGCGIGRDSHTGWWDLACRAIWDSES